MSNPSLRDNYTIEIAEEWYLQYHEYFGAAF